MRKKVRKSRVLVYVFLVIFSLFCIFPFLWIIVGSTNSALDITAGKMTFGSLFTENLQKLFENYNMKQSLLNSIKITSISVVLILIVTSMAAYGFQMYHSRVRDRIYDFFLATMMIPFAALMVPLFQIIVKMKLINNHFAIIIVSVASVFMIFFFRQSFQNYPMEVIQAARVDGATEMQIFIKIFVPSMKSTYAAAAIYAFMTSWNSYLWPLIVVQTNDKQTVTLLISSMSSSYTPEYGVIMMAIVIATLPAIIVFFAFQKQFVQGMLGSVKE
ncbi:MAG: ABC-type sugar transport system, permease component [Oscillospiraceae bacterium]|jgi:lactose/L-arabinose transport system permease protein